MVGNAIFIMMNYAPKVRQISLFALVIVEEGAATAIDSTVVAPAPAHVTEARRQHSRHSLCWAVENAGSYPRTEATANPGPKELQWNGWTNAPNIPPAQLTVRDSATRFTLPKKLHTRSLIPINATTIPPQC